MPWWVWLILVLAMIVVLALGLAYAGLHALDAFKSVSDTAAKLGERIGAMGAEPVHNGGSEERPVAFTQTLADSAEDYSKAHTAVVIRQAARHEAHARRWRTWRARSMYSAAQATTEQAREHTSTTNR